MARSNRRPTPLAQVGGALAAIGGIAVGRYSGINLLIPVAAAFAVGFAANKLVSPEKRPIVRAFAVQAGHGIWMAFGIAIIDEWSWNIGDLVILGGGLAWLLIAPGLGPAILLGIYQAIALTVNTVLFVQADASSGAQKALLVHILFRVAAIAYLIKGVYTLRRRKAEASVEAAGSELPPQQSSFPSG